MKAINISQAIHLRRTFRKDWRLICSITCWLLMLIHSNAFYGYSFLNFEGFQGEHKFYYYSVFCGLIVGFFFFFRKVNFLSRLFYALVSCFSGLNIASLYLYVFFPSELSTDVWLRVIFLIVILISAWKLFLGRGLVLIRSLFIYFRKNAYTELIRATLYQVGRLRNKTSETNKLNLSYLSFVIMGVPALGLGVLIGYVLFILIFNGDAFDALWHSDYPTLLTLLLECRVNWGNTFSTYADKYGFWNSYLIVMPIFLAIFLSFWWFGYLWNRWRRKQIHIEPGRLSDNIKPSDILYLRGFKNEIQQVPGRDFKGLNVLLSAYEKNFTFEELITNQLKSQGQLIALRDPNKKKDYPLLGAIRYEEKENWEHVVREAIPQVKLIVVLLNGEITNSNNSLRKEINWIKEFKCSYKSIFIIPGAKKSYKKKMWDVFSNQLFPKLNLESQYNQIRASSINAITFPNGEPCLIHSHNKFYGETTFESVIDIASDLLTESASMHYFEKK